jgi:hypothetical protein
MQILNPAVLTVFVLGLSFGAASPARAGWCEQKSAFLQTCGSQCISVLHGCCGNGNWYCPQGDCYPYNGYLYCCDGSQSFSQGQCFTAGGSAVSSTSPTQ